MDNLGFEKEGQTNKSELNIQNGNSASKGAQSSSSNNEQTSVVEECSVDLENKGAIPKSSAVRKREPRMIHCRDGVISEDEIGKLYEQFDEPLSKTVSRWTEGWVPAECSWPAWFGFYTVFVFVHVIIVCEFFGEKLANFFGIMDSKYSYVLDEHYRNLEKRREIERSLAMEPEVTLTNIRHIDPEDKPSTSFESPKNL